MGISCDVEVGSMDSETKPTCNRESLKLIGQDVCNAAVEAKTAKTALSIVVDGMDAKNPTTVIDLVSPTPQETEPILIGDDAEPEEGEIINTDNEFEYEAISSDEEFTLRQQIEALEAKNRELEKIASISSRTIDYDYHRSSIYNNYKIPLASNRPNITKTNPPLSSTASNFKTLPLPHVECISSDIDSENEMPSVYDGNKLYGRSHRSSSKKEKRQNRRNKLRTIHDGDKERCLMHGKRRCTDIDCTIVEVTSVSRKKRVRHKHDSDRKIAKPKYLSDSEDELLRNREELKMALNIIEPSVRTINTTLLHKLSIIQNQHTLDDEKKATVKHRKRKSSHSPAQELNKRSKHIARTETNGSKKSSKNECIRNSEHIKSSALIANDENDENGVQDDDDEHISLEEQELRLIALKSAVLKKHEARKRKQLAIVQACEQVVRPYSPTDSIVLVADETNERNNDCQIDSDNNNMDISPISSPTNQYQPMDMDLVSSNENSKSPVFSYEKPQKSFPPQTFPTQSFDPFIDWGTVHIPVPINAATAFVDIDQVASALNQSYAIQPPYSLIYDANIPKEPILVEDSAQAIQSDTKENEPHDNEAEELRAQLIEQMRTTNSDILESSSGAKAIPSTRDSGDVGNLIVPKESGASNVDSLEEDCLRSLLLSSKGKKSNILKETTNEPHVPHERSSKFTKVTESIDCAKGYDDMPKLALNLREALKRLKSNQQNKIAGNSSKNTPNNSDANHSAIHKQDEHENKHDYSLQSCDQNENRKTVVVKRIDKNENELLNTEQPADAVEVPSTETKSAELENEADIRDIVLTESNESAVVVVTPAAATSVTTAAVAITLKSTTAVGMPSDAIITEQKTITNIPKEIHVTALKTAKKLVKTKESSKRLANQSAVKSAPIPKPNQKSTVESFPPAAPPRPGSSTPPTVLKVNASVTVNSSTINLNKIESIRRSSGSPVIATWTAKPVKKLIISLNEDSSSDTDDMENSTIKKTDSNTKELPTNAFQVRLDQFLKTVRANTNATLDIKQPLKTSATKKTTSISTTDEKETLQKNQTPSTLSTSSSQLESSKAVNHLPISSQLEYHRLLNRMKLLEKQKEQKSRLKNQQHQPSTDIVPAAVEGNLTVIVQNENRIIQTNKALSMDDSCKNTLDVTKIVNDSTHQSSNKSPLTASNTSLVKRVLVKNAIVSSNTPKVTNESKPAITSATSTLTIKPGQNEPASTIVAASGGKESTPKAKPTAMSLAMFAKKTPKIRASLLANYVKRYCNQREQYLCGLAKLHRLTSRTNLETRKQQKLEQALIELRRQTKIVEEKLTQQKTLTHSLYPAMVTAEKAVNTDRLLMQKLENCCNRLGNIVNGADYKVQSEKESEIKDKIIQITIEKNKLKLLTHKTPIISQVPKNTDSKIPPQSTSVLLSASSSPKPHQTTKPSASVQLQSNLIPISKQCDTTEIQRKSEPAKCTTQNQPNDCVQVDALNNLEEKGTCEANGDADETCMASTPVSTPSIEESNADENLSKPIQDENKIVPSIEAAGNANKNHSISEIQNVHTLPTNENNHASIVNSTAAENTIESATKVDDESLKPDNLTQEQVAANNATDNETVYGQYDSPLDHMENCVETQPSVSDADRNAIVCPYDLMGRCEDKQCKYKHILM